MNAFTIFEVVARTDKTKYYRRSCYANGNVIYFRNLEDASQYADTLVRQKHNGILHSNVVPAGLPAGRAFW